MREGERKFFYECKFDANMVLFMLTHRRISESFAPQAGALSDPKVGLGVPRGKLVSCAKRMKFIVMTA